MGLLIGLGVLGFVIAMMFIFGRSTEHEQRYIGRNARYSGVCEDGRVVEGEIIIDDEMDDQAVMDYIAKYLVVHGEVGRKEYYSLHVQYVDIWER